MTMRNHGFELPTPKVRGSRQAKILREEGVDVGDAVSLLEEADRGATYLTESVKKFAAAANALMQCGLTENAVAVLIQDLMGNARNGKLYPIGTILEVLHAAARLNEHLKEES